MEILEHLVFWHWLTLAAILLILEVATGSGFILWIGISAGCVGILLWVIPELSWITQCLMFALLAMMSGGIWAAYLKHHPIRTDRPTLNRRGTQYIGQVFTLDAPIVNGIGKVKVDDTMWRVHCTDLPAGAKIKIVGIDGVMLQAKPEQ